MNELRYLLLDLLNSQFNEDIYKSRFAEHSYRHELAFSLGPRACGISSDLQYHGTGLSRGNYNGSGALICVT